MNISEQRETLRDLATSFSVSRISTFTALILFLVRARLSEFDYIVCQILCFVEAFAVIRIFQYCDFIVLGKSADAAFDFVRFLRFVL